MNRKMVVGLLFMGLLLTFCGATYAISENMKAIENEWVSLVQQVRPEVVNIDTKGTLPESQADGDRYNDLFRFFGIPLPGPEGGGPKGMVRPNRMAQGSGFIYDKEGHIITNNHMVEGAETIKVKLSTGKEYDAKVVGTDPDTDLAVIKIEANGDLPAARLGDSSQLKVGQYAMAVGSPRGFEGSFSFGHISALGREDLSLPGLRFQDFIQTDAAINLGNSGGPLVNSDGEVIGINIAIVYGANSLGFAIPINTAKEIVPTLISKGKVVRGFLGVVITNVHSYAEAVGLSDDKGAFVKTVQPGTPAEQAGIKPYDVIRKVNGKEVESAGSLVRLISEIAPGASAKLEVWRDKKPIEVEVKLQEYQGNAKEAAAHGKEVLGISVQNITPDMVDHLRLKTGTTGVIISDIDPNSPAAEAGLSQGDIITEVAQQKVTNVDDFQKLVKDNATPGKSLLIGFIRGGTEHDITVIRVPKEKQ